SMYPRSPVNIGLFVDKNLVSDQLLQMIEDLAYGPIEMLLNPFVGTRHSVLRLLTLVQVRESAEEAVRTHRELQQRTTGPGLSEGVAQEQVQLGQTIAIRKLADDSAHERRIRLWWTENEQRFRHQECWRFALRRRAGNNA